MHNTNYVIKFVLIMTSLVALVLSGMYTVLKPIHQANEAVYNKKAILSAVASQIDGLKELSNEQVEEIFANQIDQKVINMNGDIVPSSEVEKLYKGGKAENVDMAKEKKKDETDRILPFYTYTNDKGEKTYIVSVRGNGLWDEIWGNIALKADLNTISGVDFDHKAETPGLGAEIKDNSGWKSKFIGRKLYTKNGEYKSIDVIKGGAKDLDHEVDGISGATITGVGVGEMMKRGIKYYEPYFKKIK